MLWILHKYHGTIFSYIYIMVECKVHIYEYVEPEITLICIPSSTLYNLCFSECNHRQLAQGMHCPKILSQIFIIVELCDMYLTLKQF